MFVAVEEKLIKSLLITIVLALQQSDEESKINEYKKYKIKIMKTKNIISSVYDSF